MKVRFAHVSDCHLGAWRKDSMNQIGYDAFAQMVDIIIEEKIDFLLISGDLYDVSNPKVDVIDFTTTQLKRLKDSRIGVYGILGSHDFSPSNKSMIRPLISADLFTNVCIPNWTDDEKYPLQLNFVEDKKTQIKIIGMRARKRTLELRDYLQLNKQNLEEESGNKIFLLHTMLNELRPLEYKDMLSGPSSLLPKDFIYYAGGHIHKTIPDKLRDNPIDILKSASIEKKVIYPGSLFPTNFRELEQYNHGGFCIISGENPFDQVKVKYVPLKIIDVINLYVNADNKTIEDVKDLIGERIKEGDFKDRIVVFRISGQLTTGRPFDINVNEIFDKIREKEAYEVMVNKVGLTSREYEKVQIDPEATIEEIENRLIHEHAEKTVIYSLAKDKLEKKIHDLLEVVGSEPAIGEVKKDFHTHIKDSLYKILNIKVE